MIGSQELPRGTGVVPGNWLETLAVDMKLTRFEWRVVAVVLARQPVTAWRVARILRLAYSHVKRAVRELVRWNILTASSEGLRFQSNQGQWGDNRGPATAPGISRNVRTGPSKRVPPPAEPEWIVL